MDRDINPDTVYILDGDTLLKLWKISDQLHNGTFQERDYGHRLWLLLNFIQEYDLPDKR